jgi:hypothetical protein
MSFPSQRLANSIVNTHKDTPELLPDYEPSAGAIVKALHSLWGQDRWREVSHLDGRQRSGSVACFAVLSETALRA